jgi:hypothetical protein
MLVKKLNEEFEYLKCSDGNIILIKCLVKHYYSESKVLKYL